jgi:hypothetical protein
MDAMFNLFKEFFQIAPGPAALIIVAWMYFIRKPSNDNGKFVLKESCHMHIDALNESMKEIKEDIRELRDLLFKKVSE